MNHAQQKAMSTSRLAFQATTRCGIAEVLGLGNSASIVLGINRSLIARGLGHAVVHGAHS